jgi:hypothetical protein
MSAKKRTEEAYAIPYTEEGSLYKVNIVLRTSTYVQVSGAHALVDRSGGNRKHHSTVY